MALAARQAREGAGAVGDHLRRAQAPFDHVEVGLREEPRSVQVGEPPHGDDLLDGIVEGAAHGLGQVAEFARHVAAEAPGALVHSGVETDVCVLATAMSAVDLGYRTVIATDAVASSVSESHDACLAHVYPRYDQQIELADVSAVLAAWSVP